MIRGLTAIATTGMVTVLAAGPALATPSTFKPKLGTYKGRTSTGKSFRLKVGPCDDETATGPLCLTTPDDNNAYALELFCKGLNGAGDGTDDYELVGPLAVRNGHISYRNTTDDGFDDGSKETVTLHFVLSAKGTITGTARLTGSFSDGAHCDSGTVKLTARR